MPGVEPDIKAVADEGEIISRMEPLLVNYGSRHRPALSEPAFELTELS